jgi:hypothetical protein
VRAGEDAAAAPRELARGQALARESTFAVVGREAPQEDARRRAGDERSGESA